MHFSSSGGRETRHREPPRLDVLGTGISAIDLATAVEVIERWIGRGERRYVCVANVHSVMEAYRDPTLRRVMNQSGLTTPDGMPLVWLLEHAGHRPVSRVYGPDLVLEMCRRSAATGHRHFFLGGAEGVADTMAGRLRERFPGLHVVGTLSPPFRLLTAEEDEALVETVNQTAPDVVWVGLGAPKQEHWMAAHRDRLSAPALIGVGAAFDFHAGAVRQAPPVLQRTGLEWAYRLAREPRRLWHRYLVYNPWFVVLVARRMLWTRGGPASTG